MDDFFERVNRERIDALNAKIAALEQRCEELERERNELVSGWSADLTLAKEALLALSSERDKLQSDNALLKKIVSNRRYYYCVQ